MAIGHPHSRSRSTKVGVPPGRVACVRTSHERTRQIDETFKYYINLAWHKKHKDSMHLAGSRESWRLSPRVNHSQRTTRESASGISSASANETNDDERVNESGERGQFVHFKESFVRTDSFANEPTLTQTIFLSSLCTHCSHFAHLLLDCTPSDSWTSHVFASSGSLRCTAFGARLVVTVFQRWRPLVFVKVLAF